MTAWFCLRLSNEWVHVQPYDWKGLLHTNNSWRQFAATRTNAPYCSSCCRSPPESPIWDRPTWPSSQTAQSPVASAEASLGLSSCSEMDGMRPVCCWCTPGCDLWAMWNRRLFTTFLQNLLHDSSTCNSQEVFVIHSEIFPCWDLPLWIS